MRKITSILLLAVLAVVFLGCSKTFYGKYITVKVKELPIEEFRAGEYTVLVFENKKEVGPEDWEYEFWVYSGRVMAGKYRFQARLVAGSRSYFLVEEIPNARPETIANFRAKPNYDRIKERLVAHLGESK